jgi:hypothetical protein
MCLLTTGFDNECNDGIGGLEPGSFLVTQKENVTATTTVAGVITVLTQTGGTSFYRYRLRKEMMNFDGANTNTPTTGSNFIDNTLVLLMAKMSATKNVELKLLTQKPCISIVRDLNGVYHAFGIETGIDFSVNSSSGKAAADMNGYTITGIDQSKERYTVSSGVMASLVIGDPS